MSTPSRNEPCPCGSGKKFKHCHVDNIDGLETGRQGRDPVPLIIMALGAVIGLAIMGTSDVQVGLAVIGGRIIALKISQRLVAVAGGLLFFVFAVSALVYGAPGSDVA